MLPTKAGAPQLPGAVEREPCRRWQIVRHFNPFVAKRAAGL
jgi:hypothetical protein